MRNTVESRCWLSSSIRLIVCLVCVVALVMGCSSRQQTKVERGLSATEEVIAPLEEASVNPPIKIKVPPALATRPQKEKPIQEPVEDSKKLNGDIFTSPGRSSSPPKFPQSTPVPALAKPDTLQGLPFTLTDVFFDYDQYTLHHEDFSILETNAKVLLGRYPKKKILIQGHCDERGTEEYNLALGVRRAQAVKDYLVDLGVPPERLQVLSYGKEKPFCTQHSWNCWKHNRRGHFVFQ